MELKELRDEIKRLYNDIKEYKDKIYCKHKYKRFSVSKPTMHTIVGKLEYKLRGIKQTVKAVDEDMEYLFKSTIWAKKRKLWQEIKGLLNHLH